MKEYSKANPVEVERLKKILDKKEVALVERAIQVERQVKKDAETKEKLQTANELFFQKDAKVEEEHQKVAAKKTKLEKKY